MFLYGFRMEDVSRTGGSMESRKYFIGNRFSCGHIISMNMPGASSTWTDNLAPSIIQYTMKERSNKETLTNFKPAATFDQIKLLSQSIDDWKKSIFCYNGHTFLNRTNKNMDHKINHRKSLSTKTDCVLHFYWQSKCIWFQI